MTLATYPSLADRVVFVTGGGSGIGAAIVTAFAQNGARVAFADIDVAASEAQVRELSGAAHAPRFVACDLLDISALRAAIALVRAEIGPVGVLVNNAANDTRQPAAEVTPEDWDRAMALNVRHQFFAAQAVRPHMQALGGGAIINFTSGTWMFGAPRMVGYASAKAAVVGMTNVLAREFGGDNIRVNAVAPGAVMTPRQLRLWHTPEDYATFVERQCLHRQVLTEDVARAVLFLAADDSRMITKQCLLVDGGLR